MDQNITTVGTTIILFPNRRSPEMRSQFTENRTTSLANSLGRHDTSSLAHPDTTRCIYPAALHLTLRRKNRLTINLTKILTKNLTELRMSNLTILHRLSLTTSLIRNLTLSLVTAFISLGVNFTVESEVSSAGGGRRKLITVTVFRATIFESITVKLLSTTSLLMVSPEEKEVFVCYLLPLVPLRCQFRLFFPRTSSLSLSYSISLGTD